VKKHYALLAPIFVINPLLHFEQLIPQTVLVIQTHFTYPCFNSFASGKQECVMSSERSESRHLKRSLHSARPAIAELSPVGMTREKTLRAFSTDFCDKSPFIRSGTPVCQCLPTLRSFVLGYPERAQRVEGSHLHSPTVMFSS